MIVLKIGGSSVDSAAAIGRVVELVHGFRDRRPVVVVSAMARTTRKLLESAEAAAAGDAARCEALYREIVGFHRGEAEAAVPLPARAVLDRTVAASFAELRQALARVASAGHLSPREADAVASCGELVSSAILSAALAASGLQAPWIDCREVVVTDGQHTRAHPLYGPTDARLRAALLPLLEAGAVPVLGGYVGATEDGVPTTLGKEGSDFSAAIVGAALGATEVVICTDVEGILTADPRLVPGARRIRTLSFAETLELACSGGKKPHFGTLEPAARAGVPLRIVPSRAAHGEGTVVGRRASAPPGIKSIACRTNAHHLTLTSPAFPRAEDLVDRLAEDFERLRPALQLLDAEGGRVVLGLDRADRLEEARAALAATLGGGGSIEVGPGGAAITLVSEDLGSDSAFAARTLERVAASIQERVAASIQERVAALPVLTGTEPKLLLRGVAAPVVRVRLQEEDREENLTPILADLHGALFPGPPQEVVP